MKAFNVPIPDIAKENTDQGITNDFFTESDDGLTHTVKGIPYIFSEKLYGGQILRNYYEYILQVVRNILYTDYLSIPYMRHMLEPLENILFDLATENKKDDIELLLYEKLKNSDITLISVDVVFNREERTAKINCKIKIKGILLNTAISKSDQTRSDISINLA